MTRRHLTKEDIRQLAAQCSTRTEFSHLDSAAYKKACELHIIAELFPKTLHHEPWNKETCKVAALSCKSRREFETKYSSAWKLALRNGWLDEWLPKEHKDITEDRCREVAMQCHSRSEFRRKADHLYNYALKHHLIDTFAEDYSWLPTSLVAANAQRKYSDADVEREAKKYTRLSTFRRKSRRMYEIANERKLLPSFTWLYRNEDVVKYGFHDSVYVYEFVDTKTAYIGRTVNRKTRDNQHHHNNSCVKRYADSIGAMVPTVKYIAVNQTPEQGQRIEAETIANYTNDGWSLLNKQSHSGLGTLTTISKKDCIEFARQFEFWRDLYKASPGKFKAIKKYGWDAECTWLKYKHAPKGTWSNASFEKIQQKASNYTTRTEFQRDANAAYDRAHSAGWMDKLFPITKKPKAIAAYDPATGKLVKKWPSIKAAALELNTWATIISRALRGEQKTLRGLIYRYVQ